MVPAAALNMTPLLKLNAPKSAELAVPPPSEKGYVLADVVTLDRATLKTSVLPSV
ncbi:hypothetical protein MCEZEM1_02747 [Comamonadaceae bacterium]